jgi:hypothetical protein
MDRTRRFRGLDETLAREKPESDGHRQMSLSSDLFLSSLAKLELRR